jgi:hypothetical protein
MIKNLVGRMVIAMRRLFILYSLTQLLTVTCETPIIRSITQAFQIQLQSFGNIVIINLFAEFVYRKVIVTFFAQIPWRSLITPLFTTFGFWHFGQAKTSMYINFCISILILQCFFQAIAQ